MLCLRTNLAMGQSSKSCTYTLFLTQGLNIELILALRAVSEIRADFQNGHEFQKLHKYSLSTPRGWNSAYICSMGSGFRDMGQFLKLPYLGKKLGKWPKFQKLHIYHVYCLSTLRSWNWAYFHSKGSSLWDTSRCSKLPYLGMKFCKRPKF